MTSNSFHRLTALHIISGVAILDAVCTIAQLFLVLNQDKISSQVGELCNDVGKIK